MSKIQFLTLKIDVVKANHNKVEHYLVGARLRVALRLSIEISETIIMQILERNEEYINLIKSGKIGVGTLKFQLMTDAVVLVRTFSQKGFEAATYFVKEDNMLHLYDKVFNTDTIYSKNGLNAVEYAYYEECKGNEEGRMIYRMLDKRDLDPVGDGFYLHDAIDFVDSYPAWKSAD